MQLRMATPGDVEVIRELRLNMLREVAGELPEGLSEAIQKYLDEHLRDKTCICALLEQEGHVIGKAMLCVYGVMPDEINLSGKCATLFSVYTSPEYRGRGYMEKLLRYLLERAGEDGIREVLACAEEKAIPLYQRIGFVCKRNEMSIRL